MTLLLFICILAPQVDAFIQFWGPMNGMYSPMQPFANQMPMSNMMYIPRPPMYQPAFFPPRPMLQPPRPLLQPPQSLMPSVPPNLPPTMNFPTTTPNSFLSIFDALAAILQREAQKSQYTRVQELAKPQYPWERSNLPENVQISDPNDAEIPEFPQENPEGLSSLINSIPAPEIISLMNIQAANKRMKKLKSGPPIIKSFKIEKEIDEELPPSTPIGKELSEKIDDSSLLGLLRSGRWKTIDWRRKLLGLDEIPTAEEGNALAQLFPLKDKED
ncbi:unnamed protein product [Auanema sp. JU1783]|nr:unnamed protein product [Auanema sp. JU1783]